MLAVKSVDVRANFKSFCDKVFKGETLIVSRPKNENIVMISLDEYNQMLKIIKNQQNAEYLSMLDRSFAELESNDIIIKTMDELRAMENK